MGRGHKWTIRSVNCWAENRWWPSWSSCSLSISWLWYHKGRKVKQKRKQTQENLSRLLIRVVFSPWIGLCSGCSTVLLTNATGQGEHCPTAKRLLDKGMWRSVVGKKCSSLLCSPGWPWLWGPCHWLSMSPHWNVWQQDCVYDRSIPGNLLAAVTLCCVHNTSKAAKLPV